MPKPERTAAILVAAGRGLRAGAGGPKQYRSIGGQTRDFPRDGAVLPPSADVRRAAGLESRRHRHVQRRRAASCDMQPPANGGATRQASVHAGLEALAGQKPDIVLIHDAARPFVTAALISRAIEAAGRTGAAVPAIPVTDTDQAGRRRPATSRRRRSARGCGSHKRRRRSASMSFSTPIAAPRARAAAISPTMRRWRNGRD